MPSESSPPTPGSNVPLPGGNFTPDGPERVRRKPPRVVLVRPAFAGNIGAVARAMTNFGLTELVLVAPRADLKAREARALSTRGEPLLDSARLVGDLPEAIGDCVWSAATSANISGPYRGPLTAGPAEVFAEEAIAAVAGPTALVFGPEDHGLTNREMALCGRLLTLPVASAGYPVLNLSQAVMLCLYEWFAAGGQARGVTATTPRADGDGQRPRATLAHRERMFARLEDALTRVGFLFADNPQHLMFALRHLINRAQPSPTETDILLGLARQLRWYTDTHPARPREPNREANTAGASPASDVGEPPFPSEGFSD